MPNSFPEVFWTLIVPAAGNGTRMGSSIPKALIELNGVSLFERATHQLRKYSKEIIVIIKSVHENAFKEAFDNEAEQNNRYIVQDIPRGNAFAVHRALSEVKTEYAVVVWGDHVGAEHFPAKRLIAELNTGNPDLCVPLTYVKHPYAYFELLEGKFVAFHETIKGAKVMEYGISDVGVFAIKVKAVLPFLDQWIVENEKSTDLNFLNFFSSKLAEKLQIRALVLDKENQFLHIGINQMKELEKYKEISSNLMEENSTNR